jgi:CheY-like chemotaxis protein
MTTSVQHILMVDDDEDDQFLFRKALKEVNTSVNCETAGNGSEALKKLQIPPPPDIIFLDLNMPVMNGFECLVVLKKEKKYKNIPVVIFTTANDMATIEQSRALGANAFFHKPIDFAHLLTKLHKLLNFIPGTNNQSVSTADFII